METPCSSLKHTCSSTFAYHNLYVGRAGWIFKFYDHTHALIHRVVWRHWSVLRVARAHPPVRSTKAKAASFASRCPRRKIALPIDEEHLLWLLVRPGAGEAPDLISHPPHTLTAAPRALRAGPQFTPHRAYCVRLLLCENQGAHARTSSCDFYARRPRAITQVAGRTRTRTLRVQHLTLSGERSGSLSPKRWGDETVWLHILFTAVVAVVCREGSNGSCAASSTDPASACRGPLPSGEGSTVLLLLRGQTSHV